MKMASISFVLRHLGPVGDRLVETRRIQSTTGGALLAVRVSDGARSCVLLQISKSAGGVYVVTRLELPGYDAPHYSYHSNGTRHYRLGKEREKVVRLAPLDSIRGSYRFPPTIFFLREGYMQVARLGTGPHAFDQAIDVDTRRGIQITPVVTLVEPGTKIPGTAPMDAGEVRRIIVEGCSPWIVLDVYHRQADPESSEVAVYAFEPHEDEQFDRFGASVRIMLTIADSDVPASDGGTATSKAE